MWQWGVLGSSTSLSTSMTWMSPLPQCAPPGPRSWRNRATPITAPWHGVSPSAAIPTTSSSNFWVTETVRAHEGQKTLPVIGGELVPAGAQMPAYGTRDNPVACHEDLLRLGQFRRLP